MLGVICAMEIEADGLIALMDDKRVVKAVDYKFIEGCICGKKVVVALSGIGKVHAAAVTALMINNFDVTEIINLGVCGGRLEVCTMIVADSIVQYDFDTTACGDELGQLDGFDSPFIKCSDRISKKLDGEARGVIASGDKFIADEQYAAFLSRRFGAIGFDMESGAVAQVCSKAGVEFAVLRVVSDGGNLIEYEKFRVMAAKKGIDAVKKYLSAD